MSELAVIGEQQETGGIHVEPTHDDPAPTCRWRQSLEDGRPALWIVARGHLADGLVIQQHFNRILLTAEVERFPIETDPVRAFGAIAERRNPIVDGHATLRPSPSLRFCPRALSPSARGFGVDGVDAVLPRFSSQL